MKVYIVYTSDGYDWDINCIFSKEDDAKSYCEFENRHRKSWDKLDYYEEEVITDGIRF